MRKLSSLATEESIVKSETYPQTDRKSGCGGKQLITASWRLEMYALYYVLGNLRFGDGKDFGKRVGAE